MNLEVTSQEQTQLKSEDCKLSQNQDKDIQKVYKNLSARFREELHNGNWTDELL
jgi:hypothetical protein